MRIEIGTPIEVARHRRAGGEAHLVCRSVMDEVMYEIQEMTGQEYQNVYAGSADLALVQTTPSTVATHVDHDGPGAQDLVSAAG
ncbi:MAG: hypothetical protein R2715_08945 [Ilumatobacteraceae bacterium]